MYFGNKPNQVTCDLPGSALGIRHEAVSPSGHLVQSAFEAILCQCRRELTNDYPALVSGLALHVDLES